MASCRVGQVKTLGGVIATSKAIDQRSREGSKEKPIDSGVGILFSKPKVALLCLFKTTSIIEFSTVYSYLI